MFENYPYLAHLPGLHPQSSNVLVVRERGPFPLTNTFIIGRQTTCRATRGLLLGECTRSFSFFASGWKSKYDNNRSLPTGQEEPMRVSILRKA